MSVSKKRGFFGAIISPQSYLNIVYLLLAFPLGTFYFVFLVTGLSLGFGLIITLIGIPILLLVFGGVWVLCKFERNVAIAMLKVDIPNIHAQPTAQGLWSRSKMYLTDRVTWTGTLYLLFKFPIGIVTFTIAVTLIALSLGLVFAPAYMWTTDPVVWNWANWTFDPFPWSWILTLIGIPVLFVSLNLLNNMATAFGEMTKAMLSK